MTCKTHNNPQPKIKSSLLIPSDIKVYRQVPLNNTNISEETKLALHKFLQNFNSIISKSDNDIGETGLVDMHIGTRSDSTAVAA